VLDGTLDAPRLTGPTERVRQWAGLVSNLAARARSAQPTEYPTVAVEEVNTSVAKVKTGQIYTAQGAQVLLFLLTMLLAGMVLSNLVEEKGNKIIEVLAAAIPMDAMFMGKLFAMLAVSLVGIAVWGTGFGLLVLAGGKALPALSVPAVGWPLFLTLGFLYFAMAYLLLGSLFLSIGGMASTVREVQTLSMPVSMFQLMVFFFASFALTMPGTWVEWASILFPVSSPYAMLARAAQQPEVWPHMLALTWQGLWVAVIVRTGAALFRRTVMKSGPSGAKRSVWARLFRRKGATA
jgi:ABC-2 type transport system permease protein